MTPQFIKLHPKTYKKLSLLKREAAAHGAHRVANRIHWTAVLLNHDMNTSGKIAKTLKASQAGVSEWLKIYDEHGFEGLKEGERSGRVTGLLIFKKLFSVILLIADPLPLAIQVGFGHQKELHL